MSTPSLDYAIDVAQPNATLPPDEIYTGFDLAPFKKVIALMMWYGHIKIVLAVLAVVFTAIVLFVITSQRSFHNVTNCFIANLMVSDFGMAACNMVDGARWIAYGGNSYSECGGIITYLIHVSMQASCSTLILLTLTRYDAILNPLQSINRWNKKRISIAITLSWILSVLLHIPTYFLVCNPTTPLEITIQLYMYTVMFLIPSLLLIFCYARIVCAVMRNTFRANQRAASSSTCDVQRKGRTAQQGKLTRMVAMILLVFVFLRAPVHTFTLYKFMVGWPLTHLLRDRIYLFVFLLLDQLNNMVDPFVYAFCAPQFRTYLAEKMRCRTREGSQACA